MKFIIFALIVSIGLGYVYYNYIGDKDVPLTNGVKNLGENLAGRMEGISIDNNPTIASLKEKASDMANMALGAASEHIVNNDDLRQSLFGIADKYLKKNNVLRQEVDTAVKNLMALSCSDVEEGVHNFFNGISSSSKEFNELLMEMKNSGMSNKDILKSMRIIYCE